MWRKSCARVCRETSASVPASSTPVGPPPDDHEGHPRPAPRVVRLALGDLECHQHPLPDLQRVPQALQPGRMLGPIVVAEIGVGRAGRDDQDVVIDGGRRPARRVSRPTSTAVASASMTATFSWPRKIRRIGAAMSAGLSAAVATW